MPDDSALLQRFAVTRAEDDFAELVHRHLALVYSAALRQVGGDHQFAEEVAQNVFADLARKAATMTNHVSLAGWLYTSAHYAAVKIVRGERRRRWREQEASKMQQTHANESAKADWEQLQPVIDEAMHALPEADREVILQRYFERKPFLQIGAPLGLTENAARMRAERALDKLRGILATRGVSATTVALATVLMAQAVVAVPATLSGMVVSTSLAAATGVVAGGGLLTAAKLKMLIPSVCAVVMLFGVVWQQQALNRLREENERLQRAQQAAVVVSPAPTVTKEAELEAQQREKLELLRLRGEVGGIRRELAELKALAAKLEDTNSIPVQAATKVDTQINFRARFFSGTDDVLESFPDDSTDVVAPLEMSKTLKRLKESEKVEFLGEGEVTTLSGRQAQVNFFEAKTNVSTGAVTESGYYVDLLATVGEDGRSMSLNLIASKVTDRSVVVVGETRVMPLTVIKVPPMIAKAVVWDGQTVAMARRFDGKKLMVFVTPTLIDPAGNRVHSDTAPEGQETGFLNWSPPRQATQ